LDGVWFRRLNSYRDGVQCRCPAEQLPLGPQRANVRRQRAGAVPKTVQDVRKYSAVEQLFLGAVNRLDIAHAVSLPVPPGAARPSFLTIRRVNHTSKQSRTTTPTMNQRHSSRSCCWATFDSSPISLSKSASYVTGRSLLTLSRSASLHGVRSDSR